MNNLFDDVCRWIKLVKLSNRAVIVSELTCFCFIRAENISGVSGRLVQAAKQKGSLDNISIIVVFLRDPSLIARRPLPPAPESPPPSAQATPTMEEQRKEFEELTAKWGWSDPAGGAVFNELPWQDQQNPASTQTQIPVNPFRFHEMPLIFL